MVKLFGMMVLYKKGDGEGQSHILRDAYELSSFGFFQVNTTSVQSVKKDEKQIFVLYFSLQRKSVEEFLVFTGKLLSDRTQLGDRQSVKEGEYMVHAYANSSTSLVGVVFSDHDYQQRVAHNLLTKILDDFAAQVPRSSWPVEAKVNGFGELEVMLNKYQKPEEADPMTKVQNELDETKIILHNTIAAVLDRGEKLDDLVFKSEGLSLQSKTFYKTARKTNSCCGSWT